jgi:phytol kinase
MKREFARQGMHLGFTVSLAFVSLILSQEWFVLLVAALLVWLVLFVRFRPESKSFLRAMEREHDKKRFPGKGAILLLVGALITGLLFYAHILPALLVLGVADSLSTIIGMRFGKKKIFRTNKSWIGTATFFVCSCVVLIFFSSWWLLISLIATLAELVNYHRFLLLDDNLVIPLVVALTLWVL